jgi:hypothetical protein
MAFYFDARHGLIYFSSRIITPHGSMLLSSFCLIILPVSNSVALSEGRECKVYNLHNRAVL